MSELKHRQSSFSMPDGFSTAYVAAVSCCITYSHEILYFLSYFFILYFIYQYTPRIYNNNVKLYTQCTLIK